MSADGKPARGRMAAHTEKPNVAVKRGERTVKPASSPREDGLQKKPGLAGTQTLVRGLDVIDAVAQGATTLSELAAAMSLTRSTTHRLAGTLVERRYLVFSRNGGYMLGPKLLELGYETGRRMDLPRVAREYLEALSASTGDTVHLGVLDGERALYLDKIQGSRRVEISSRIGDRQPLRSTGLGKALILDASESQWREFYDYEARQGMATTSRWTNGCSACVSTRSAVMRLTWKKMKTGFGAWPHQYAVSMVGSWGRSVFRAPPSTWMTGECAA